MTPPREPAQHVVINCDLDRSTQESSPTSSAEYTSDLDEFDGDLGRVHFHDMRSKIDVGYLQSFGVRELEYEVRGYSKCCRVFGEGCERRCGLLNRRAPFQAVLIPVGTISARFHAKV